MWNISLLLQVETRRIENQGTSKGSKHLIRIGDLLQRVGLHRRNKCDDVKAAVDLLSLSLSPSLSPKSQKKHSSPLQVLLNEWDYAVELAESIIFLKFMHFSYKIRLESVGEQWYTGKDQRCGVVS